jgi:CubicO group peptidase (beta-lactamase class C family)
MTPPQRDYWPTDYWRHASPAAHGFNITKLDDAVTFVRDFNMGGGRQYKNGSWVIERHADALLVVRGGYMVVEKYWGSTTNTTLHDIESGGKSVASIVLASAVHAGHLSLDDNITNYFPQLKPLNPDAAAVPLRVRNCVSMAAGATVTPWQAHSPKVPSCFDWNEQFRRGPPGQPDFVANHGLSKRPGSEFVYSFANTGLMSGVMTKATNLSYAEYAAKHVFPPLGIANSSWRWFGDREGNTEGDGDSYHTAPNYARLAYLMLNGGKWDGEQLLDPGWVDGAGAPSPKAWTPCENYSHFFWRKPLEGVPRDAFYAWGGGGQFAVIVPSLDLVVVTLYGGRLSRFDPPPDVAKFQRNEHFPTAVDTIATTRDNDALCAGSRGWNWTFVEAAPAWVTPSRPAAEVPGGTSCGAGNTKGDMLTGMMSRIAVALE